MDSKLWLRTICQKNSLAVTDEQLLLLEKFSHELVAWNAKINLISRRDEENIWQKHILASVSFLFKCSLMPNTSVLDIGTGGGLPGIPLAILLPEVKFALVDSVQKKIVAVQDMITKLGLNNVMAIAGRVEALAAEPEMKNTFDYVVSRAVAPAREIVRWGRPYLKKAEENVPLAQPESGRRMVAPGAILLLKGGDLEQELRHAVIKYHPRAVEVIPLEAFEDGISPEKKLVLIQP